MNDICYLMGRSNNVDDILKNADLFIMTSDYEGMPNSLMEAMAIGVPCISSMCKTGPKDLIENNKTGILFEVGNKKELVEKIDWALSHTNQMNEMGKCAKRTINEMYTNYFSKSKFDIMINSII